MFQPSEKKKYFQKKIFRDHKSTLKWKNITINYNSMEKQIHGVRKKLFHLQMIDQLFAFQLHV